MTAPPTVTTSIHAVCACTARWKLATGRGPALGLALPATTVCPGCGARYAVQAGVEWGRIVLVRLPAEEACHEQ